MSESVPKADVPVLARRTTAPSFRRIIDGRVLSLLVVFILLAIYFHVASDGVFFSPRNVSLLLRQASIVAVVSAGVSILMIMGEIDLSIGSAVFLCSIVAATAQVKYGIPTLPAVLLTLATGLALGAWQGAWVVSATVPSFVVTLAGLLAFRGIGFVASDAETISPVSKTFSFLSEGFLGVPYSLAIIALIFSGGFAALVSQFTRDPVERRDKLRLGVRVMVLIVAASLLAWVFSGFRGIPLALVWVAVEAFFLWILMGRTKFGRNAYMIGSNRQASILAGVPLKAQLFLGFVLMGLLYGVGGVLITARLGGATPSSGTFLELDAIASAVIGGTSLRGGVGTVAGAMVGAVLLTTIDNGMSILDVSAFLQLVVKGLVLLLAVSFDSYMIRRHSYR
jgi:D-xylose transport system permease protein